MMVNYGVRTVGYYTSGRTMDFTRAFGESLTEIVVEVRGGIIFLGELYFSE